MAASALAGPAQAGAWSRIKGEALVIVKYERMRAEQGFTSGGDRLGLPAPRRDAALSVFAEYGLTDRLTLRVKGDWQSGRDAFVDYDGRGPLEIGLNWTVWRDDSTSISLYGGVAEGGEGRNAGYAAPGEGGRDWEARLAAGRSLMAGRLFLEVQAARRFREGLADETRLDLTAGVNHGEWMGLVQAFAGQADGGARWLSVESGVVRRFGDWSLQLGWRTTLLGRETPVASGPVLGVWRRF